MRSIAVAHALCHQQTKPPLFPCPAQVLLEEAERRGGKDGLLNFLIAADGEMGRTALHYAVCTGSEDTIKASDSGWFCGRLECSGPECSGLVSTWREVREQGW